MDNDIIVNHDGRDWLVRDGRLVPIRYVEVNPGRTVEEINANMAASAAGFRAKIIEYVRENDPYFKF